VVAYKLRDDNLEVDELAIYELDYCGFTTITPTVRRTLALATNNNWQEKRNPQA
jgi:hypothetical protein